MEIGIRPEAASSFGSLPRNGAESTPRTLVRPRSARPRSTDPVQRNLGKRRPCEQRPVVNLKERITVDPEQCGGKPCIRGMRIRVKDILEMLGSGMMDADILTEFPYLEAADLRAA